MHTRAARLLITVALSVGLGLAATGIVANSENGYTAGFVVLPLLFLELVACVVLIIVGIVFLIRQNLVCVYFFLAALLLPSTSIGSALLAKQFEIGAYKVEPMRPIMPVIANKILFNRDISSEGVQDFLQNDLNDPLDAIQSVGNGSPEDGREVVVFSFFEGSSEDAKEIARKNILNSPKVYKIIENVDTRILTSPRPTIDPIPGPYKIANMQASPIPQKY